MKLHFLGANRQVTGSRYLLEAGGLQVLIDCGLFQERPFLSRNWDSPPIDPREVDFLLLTHAHLDHCGLIPKFVREGFSKPILTTAPSIDLARLVLEDSAKIQEEDAAYKRKRHEREHRQDAQPDLPLYTVQDAERAFGLFQPVPYNESIRLNGQVSARYREAGHILGSAMIEITVREGSGGVKTLLFSGDIGQWNKPLIRDPSICAHADAVVMESTYGDRNHDVPEKIGERLAQIINETVQRGGNVVIPTFAIDRAQELIYHFSLLLRDRRIPKITIFLDSPMAVDATAVFKRYSDLLDVETLSLIRAGRNPFRFPGLQFVRTSDESRAINTIREPVIIMAGAGMCTGGRIKHHLSLNLSRPESTILFVGYQAQGTLGREILDGAQDVRIHGVHHRVQAHIARLDGLSAHADRQGLLYWVGKFQSPPQRLFLTHGEEPAANSLAAAIRSDFGWPVEVPPYLHGVDL